MLHPTRCGLIALALLVAPACRAPEADTPAEGSAAAHAGADAVAAVDEGSADPWAKPDEDLPNNRERPRRTLRDTLASVADSAWMARIPTITTSYDASEIRGLLRRDDGTVLAMTAQRAGRETTYHTWAVSRDPEAAELTPLTAFVIRAPEEAEARVLALPGQGFVMLKASDNVADASAPSTTLYWRMVSIGGVTQTDPVALETPGWSVRREYTASVVGARIAVCFQGFAEGTDASGPYAIVCGALDERGAWATPPTQVVPASIGAVEAVIGTGDADRALLMTFEGDRMYGRLLTFGPALAIGAPADLSGETIGSPSAYHHRREPQVITAGDLTAYALPGFEEHHPRAGMIDAAGQIVGGKRQIPELGTYATRPAMLATAVGPTMLYGEYGLDGERTAVIYTGERPNPVETFTPLGTLPPASQARLGATGDGLVALVFDIDDEDATVTAIFEQSLIGSLRGVPTGEPGAEPVGEPADGTSAQPAGEQGVAPGE